MAYEINNYSVRATFVAGADLSALQYTFVKLNSSGQVVAVAAATDVPIGVLQNNPASGAEASVTIVGGTKIVASAAATLGTALNFGTTSAGKAVTLAVTDTTKYVLGVYLEAPAADGNIVAAVVNCATPTRAN
jgi:predicted ribonuclease toxin of YeeF-YezG toxin-antitoxin module